MYVKTKNNEVEKYPYTIENFRKDYPNIMLDSLSGNDRVLSSLGIYKVEMIDPVQVRHDIGYIQQHVIPTLVDGKWILGYNEVYYTEKERQNYKNSISEQIRAKRNKLLSETDWRFRVDMNPSQEWIDYCQELRNITEQPGFPFFVEWPVQPE